MTLQTARTRAEQIANDLHIAKPAVHVDEVAVSLGLTVLHQTLPEDISGMLVSRGSGGCIVVQATDPEHRQRFTIAHEIGHYCLKHQFEPGAHLHIDRGFTISFRTRFANVDRREAEANEFAATLLMPARLVRTAVSDLHTKSLSEFHIEGLAGIFRVSVPTVMLRLTFLGMA
jgi:Zn-dependent peptidase ImmA (M78 family)